MPPDQAKAKPNPRELEHAWTREEGAFAPTPYRARQRLVEEERLRDELREEMRDPADQVPDSPRFPEDRRRHEAQLARDEEALEELHDARRQESRDPVVRRREAQAAERHAREAGRHRQQEVDVSEAAIASLDDVRSLTINTRRPLGTLQVLLPIGLGAAVLLVLAGLLGVAVFGVSAATTVAVGLMVGIVANGAVLFSLLSRLRGTDERVRLLAEIEAARRARQVERAVERQNARQPRPVRKEVRMHRVEVRPEKGRVTTEDDVYRSERPDR